MKRISFILFLCLLLGMAAPVGALASDEPETISVSADARSESIPAASETEPEPEPAADGDGPVDSGIGWDGLSWSVSSDGVLTVSGEGEMGDYTAAYRPWYASEKVAWGSITSVVIEEGVTGIGNHAFYNDEGVTSVSIPASVRSIGAGVFTLSNITTVAVAPDSPYFTVEDGVLFSRDMTELIFCPRNRTGSYAIPDTVEVIADEAFYYCLYLNRVLLPSSLRVIGDRAFVNCPPHRDLVLPEGLTDIGAQAFDCCSFENIWFPASLRHIGEEAFADADSTDSVHYAGSESDWNALSVESGNETLTVKPILFESSVSDAAVLLATGSCGETLTWMLMSDGRLTISGSGAMDDYSDLPDGERAPWWNYDRSITSLVVEDGVTVIGAFAFSSGYRIETVSLPESLREIRRGAFSNCFELEELTIPEGVATLGDNLFSWSGIRCLSLPSTVTGWGFDMLTSNYVLESIEVSPGNAFLTSADGVLFSGDMSVLIQYPTGRKGDYTVPGSVKRIEQLAFSGCRELGEVFLPDGLEELGWEAFAYSSLERITLPASVRFLDEYVFLSCPQLARIGADPASPYFKSADGVLYSADGRILFCYPSTRGGSFVIPEGVVDIFAGAFSACRSLTGITFPSSLRTIGKYAFDSCERLTEAMFPEGLTDIGPGAFSACYQLTSVSLPASVERIGYQEKFIDIEYAMFRFSELAGAFSCETLDVAYGGTEAQWAHIQLVDDPSGWTIRFASPFVGDADRSGTVNAYDAVLVLQYAAGSIDGGALDLAAAEANGDGIVDAADAAAILRMR